ncbi:MAG: High-affnity carbon uptake protein Hat/HatR, partial [Cytophagales bacterium]|nr:High-affnity carbon uptake protein Hat/HatR [Cytophagales bacterium]
MKEQLTITPARLGLVDGTSNPFPGLRPFKMEESHLFFGREGQSDEVLLKLSQNRFVAVIGPQRKRQVLLHLLWCASHFVRWLPHWHRGQLGSGGGSSGCQPHRHLADALLSQDGAYLVSDPEQRRIKRTIVSSLLRSSSLGLVEAITQYRRGTDKNFLILVDQFEELFRFKTSIFENKDSLNETLAFVNLLNNAVDYEGTPVHVAITMRSDFIGECAQFPELTSKINDSHYLIPQMTREQQRMAVSGPVAVGGAQVSPRLIQQLLNDLGDKTDQLPILQHALMRTWHYWERYREQPEEAIDIRHYEAIGTMSEASRFTPMRLMTSSMSSSALSARCSSGLSPKKEEITMAYAAPPRLDVIAQIANVPQEEVVEVIEKFREPGRSLLTPAYGVPLTGESIIDISHESLMRIWVRLKHWVDDEAKSVQQYLKLAEAAELYQIGKAGLWRPPDLLVALSWKEQHKPTLVWGQRHHPAFERTIDFLEYSKSEYDTEQRMKELQQKKALKRARTFALAMSGAAIICLGFVMWAIFEKTRAEAASILAEEQKHLADEKSIEAQKNAEEAKLQSDNAKKSMLEALENAKEAERQKEQATLAQALAEEKRLEAERASKDAENQRKIAEQRQVEAEAATQIAVENQKKATEAKERADQLRYLSLGKAMAIKSQQINEKGLRALLAQQAYDFNKDYQGYEYDHDIYDGLYYAL